MLSNAGHLRTVASNASCSLSGCSAHVWRLSRRRFLPDCDEIFALLNDDEKVRAQSFRAGSHRQEFLIARALLRILIAGYCGCPPTEVQFEYGPQGKPALAANFCLSRNLAFNMSHSADTVIIAITLGIDIGVDVEQISSGARCAEEISSTCINSNEVRILNRVSYDNRARMLLRYWTHKEAYLKAIGCGLSLPPQQVTVTFHSFQRSMIFQEKARDRRPLFGHDLPLGSAYAGAIVGPVRNQELGLFSF